MRPPAAHTLELYLDYVCPFSKKLFETVYLSDTHMALPEKYSDNVETVFRQQIQPWHPSSTLVHEAGHAVRKLNPKKFIQFSAALFARQHEFFDVSVVNETRNATYRRLAEIAGSVGVDEDKVYELLEISEEPAEDGALNTGNGVTDDVKLQVKANRSTGVHVTPTVVLDGVVVDEISSGWTEDEWEEWLRKNVK